MILFFYSDNQNSKILKPFFENSEDVVFINVLENVEEVDNYNICTTPTLIFLNNGVETERLIPTKAF